MKKLLKKIGTGLKKAGVFLYKNKRNFGIVLYFGARFIFPDYIKDNPDTIYLVDALLGTGIAHNIYNNYKKK